MKGRSLMARKTTTKSTLAKPEVAPIEDAPKLMKKPDLLDQVVARTNLKKRDVKPAVEAALAVIREALRDGSDLALPPLGKVRLVKTKEMEGGAAIMTLKLRTQKHATLAATKAAGSDEAV
jgi:nucleoid DNA-binding protein